MVLRGRTCGWNSKEWVLLSHSVENNVERSESWLGLWHLWRSKGSEEGIKLTIFQPTRLVRLRIIIHYVVNFVVGTWPQGFKLATCWVFLGALMAVYCRNWKISFNFRTLKSNSYFNFSKKLANKIVSMMLEFGHFIIGVTSLKIMMSEVRQFLDCSKVDLWCRPYIT